MYLRGQLKNENLAHKMILKNNKTTKSQTGQYINWKDGRQKEATM